MLKKSLIAAALAVSAIAGNAFALPVVTLGGTAIAGEGQTSSIAGVTVLNFNVGSIPPVGISHDAAASNLVTGSVANQYAAPPGDTSRYLTVGPTDGSPVTITIAGGADYIGFYAGSLDGYNTITFNSAGGSVTYSGSDLATFAGITANGSTSIGQYFNIVNTSAFTSVTIGSTVNAFEIDNVAFGYVPVPGSLALLGLGLVGLAGAKRRRA